MYFKEALIAIRCGHKVKLPSWGGYWCWDYDKDTITMHCKDGRVLDIRETQNVAYTLDNICSDEWALADGQNCQELGGEATFSFGEAIKYLKRGMKVKRKGWNGKGMFLFIAKTTDIETDADLSCCEELEGELILPSIVMKTADNHFCVGWLASQTDMLADDWVFVD